MFSNMTQGANAMAPQYPQGMNVPQVPGGFPNNVTPMPGMPPIPTVNPLPQAQEGQVSFNLSNMDGLWSNTKAEHFEDFEGKFPVVIEEVHLTTRKKDGMPQLAWKVKVTEGQYMNRKKTRYSTINEQGLKYLKADLETCEWHKKHTRLSDLQTPEGINDLVGIHIDATFAIKNGFQQIYFNNKRTAPQGVNVPQIPQGQMMGQNPVTMQGQMLTQPQMSQPMITPNNVNQGNMVPTTQQAVGNQQMDMFMSGGANVNAQAPTAAPPVPANNPTMAVFANAEEATAGDMGASDFAPDDLPF